MMGMMFLWPVLMLFFLALAMGAYLLFGEPFLFLALPIALAMGAYLLYRRPGSKGGMKMHSATWSWRLPRKRPRKL